MTSLTDIPALDRALEALGTRCLVLVGMMGAGKSAVGRRIAPLLNLPFIDADQAIVEAAQMPIADIFETYGEPEFRRLEMRVLVRLLSGEQRVIATGGGAFLSTETRNLIARKGRSVWLKADLETLFGRVRHKSHRPMLQTPDLRERLSALLEEREPVYALADLTVISRDVKCEQTVADVLQAMAGEPVMPEHGPDADAEKEKNDG